MPHTLTYFEPQPRIDAWPARLPSPFAGTVPHPIALRAAQELREHLSALQEPLGFELSRDAPRGKMFGVLVVADARGRLGYLRAFSGMVDGSWYRDGFVGPLFDHSARQSIWPAGEAELMAFDRQLDALAIPLAAARNLNDQPQRFERERAGAPTRALDGAPLRALEEQRRLLKVARAARSCELLEQLFAGYQITSARGEVRSLRALFAPATPPGGSGDCAAPKLFAHARTAGLRPIALAEFWWGAPPADGGRSHGRYYPSCHGKCGPVLRHMLDGLDGEPVPLFGGGAIPADEPRTVYEDPWLLVVRKPEGLLSVPGRSGLLRDAVSTRLAARYPGADAPMLVHRLDLDTSGLLLAAKGRATYVALQRQFSERAIEKRYVAWLDGVVASESGGAGFIDLPLRVDIDDRPRQIVDPVHGKWARTAWRVDRTFAERTRVLLFPSTGRTHQLRVHAAHPHGLGVPIVGDRLYGQPGDRLLLHAEHLAFAHPQTGARIEIECAAPF